MSLIRYSRPNAREISRSFNELMNEFFEPMTTRVEAGFTPRVDICENEKTFIFQVELPGVKKEDIQVELEKGILRVHGERKEEHEEQGMQMLRAERFYGSFDRSFHLPDGLDEENIQAQYENGVLRLTLSKQEKAIKKQIQIH